MQSELKDVANSHGKETAQSDRVTVRPATAADLDYIRNLSKKVFQQYGPYEKILPRWFELGITVTLLAFMEKQPVGFAMLSRLERGWYFLRVSELLAIAVDPAKWRLSIGDLLMREVERRAKELGVETLVLYTAVGNLPGQELFKKHGFISFRVRKSFYPEGQDAVMMYKDII